MSCRSATVAGSAAGCCPSVGRAAAGAGCAAATNAAKAKCNIFITLSFAPHPSVALYRNRVTAGGKVTGWYNDEVPLTKAQPTMALSRTANLRHVRFSGDPPAGPSPAASVARERDPQPDDAGAAAPAGD